MTHLINIFPKNWNFSGKLRYFYHFLENSWISFEKYLKIIKPYKNCQNFSPTLKSPIFKDKHLVDSYRTEKYSMRDMSENWILTSSLSLPMGMIIPWMVLDKNYKITFKIPQNHDYKIIKIIYQKMILNHTYRFWNEFYPLKASCKSKMWFNLFWKIVIKIQKT